MIPTGADALTGDCDRGLRERVSGWISRSCRRVGAWRRGGGLRFSAGASIFVPHGLVVLDAMTPRDRERLAEEVSDLAAAQAEGGAVI